MKPVIVKTPDGKNVEMTLSEFNAVIERVYDEGFKDGAKWADKETPIINPLEPQPYIHWDLPKPEWIDKDYTINPYEVTCDTCDNISEYIIQGKIKEKKE